MNFSAVIDELRRIECGAHTHLLNVLETVKTNFAKECKDETLIVALKTIIDNIIATEKTEKSPETPLKTPGKDVPIEERCKETLKSGVNIGKPCPNRAVTDGRCRRHIPKENTSGMTCMATMKSGTRNGEVCGAACRGGDIYCTRHKNVKCTFKDDKKKACQYGISRSSADEKYCRVHLTEEFAINTSKFLLYTNKFGNREHNYSELVFEDRKVIGRQMIDGSINTELTEEDLDCIRVYHLPINPKFNEQMTAHLQKLK